MISCETGKVKITGEIDEIKAEATVLMNAMYGAICKEAKGLLGRNRIYSRRKEPD